VHADRWPRQDAVYQWALLNHELEQGALALDIEKIGGGLVTTKVQHARRQGIGAPVADAADDQVIRRHAASDEPAAGDVAANDVPRNLPHADFIAAVADADGGD